MSRSENALIARICHDLITPCNAINLGIEAFYMSNDESLLNEVKESAEKANVFLKFIRELYVDRSDSFCYSQKSLNQLIASFLSKYRMSFALISDIENIPNIAGKIIMYNAILAKEIMPFGGKVNIKIDNNTSEITTTCIGNDVCIPSFDVLHRADLSHKNIMRFNLLKLLETSGFKIVAYQDESGVIIREQMM